MHELERSFEQARIQPSQRQDFLRALHEQGRTREPLAASIKAIVFETRIPQECLDCGILPLMRTDTPLLARFHNPGIRSTVRVWPRAFDASVHGNLDEFCSTLFDHEGWHAMENRDNPEVIAEYMPPAIIRQSPDLQRLAARSPSKQTEENALLQMHCDVRAYDWQLQNIREGFRRVSDHFERTILRERMILLDWIEHALAAA